MATLYTNKHRIPFIVDDEFVSVIQQYPWNIWGGYAHYGDLGYLHIFYLDHYQKDLNGIILMVIN